MKFYTINLHRSSSTILLVRGLSGTVMIIRTDHHTLVLTHMDHPQQYCYHTLITMHCTINPHTSPSIRLSPPLRSETHRHFRELNSAAPARPTARDRLAVGRSSGLVVRASPVRVRARARDAGKRRLEAKVIERSRRSLT